MIPVKDFEAISQRDNDRRQSGYVSKIKARGIDKPIMVTEYTENVQDGNTNYTVTVKNYVWKRGFRVPVGQYRKPDHESMIFITNNATGRTHAITYAHNEKIYWQNVKPGKGGKYEVSMPTSWHTPMLKEGTYEKMTWGGKKRGIASLDPREGRVNILYTRAAQKFANATQKLLRHTDQELPEIITALPISPEKPTAIFGYKNTHTADVKTAFAKPSELYNKAESLGSAKKKK